MNNDVNFNNEKEALNSDLNSDNSYILLENILYCSSPKNGIISKSNIKNKQPITIPFTTTSDRATYFTFNIFKEESKDITTKDQLINSQKNANIISEFKISSLENAQLVKTKTCKIENLDNSIGLEKEKEEIKEEYEYGYNIDNKKYRNRKKGNKKNKKKYIKYNSSYLDDKSKEEQYKVRLTNEKSKEKKLKKRNYRYSSIDTNDKEHEINNDKEVIRYASVNIINNSKKKKKIFKSHFYEDNLAIKRNTLKDIKDKLKSKDIIINKDKGSKDKQIKYKKNNNKIKYFKGIKRPLIKSSQNLNMLKYNDNQIKLKKEKNIKISKSPNKENNKEINSEEKNFISYPININKDEIKNGNKMFFTKSSEIIKQRLIFSKEVDKDLEKQFLREIKSAKKPYKSCMKRNKKQHFTQKIEESNKLPEENNSNEISIFEELNNDNKDNNEDIKKDLKNKYALHNNFRKSNKSNNKYNENQNQNQIDNPKYKPKKSAKFNMRLEQNKDKQYKLKSSVTLHKNVINKKSIENLQENQENKLFKRRHTIYLLKEKQNNIYPHNNNKNNKNKDKKNNSNNKEEEKNGKVNNYYDGFSKNENSNNKNTKMRIGQITEDKLILKYKNKNEIIELISDKENIDNYYEYLDLCLETLKEINLEEVPKSKVKIDFKFPNEKKNKKIALFDLDETLVHCIGEITKDNYNDPEFKNAHKIKVILPCKKEVTIGINIRPYLKDLLDKIKDIYNLVIFTASHQSYSDAVLNYLDPENKYFHYRLYRDSCVQYKKNDINFYVKDLDIFKDNYNLKDIIIIDNSILSFAYHFNNGIPVVPFYDSTQDNELPLLSFYLLSIVHYKDLREANKEHINLEFFLNQTKNEITLDEEIIYQNMSDNENINNNKMNSNKSSPKTKYIFNDDENENENKVGINIVNKSEKKLIKRKKESRNTIGRKKYNTVKLASFKILDFFEKWKNAYLQLALKK